MKALARAVVRALSFFELCDDEAMNPDDAIREMESLAMELDGCSDEETDALRSVLPEFIAEVEAGPFPKEYRERAVDFYRNFMRDLYLDRIYDEEDEGNMPVGPEPNTRYQETKAGVQLDDLPRVRWRKQSGATE